MSESKLYRKLAEVVAEVGYVAKDGKNEFQNYKYTSAEALLAAIRGPLSARQVVVMPSLSALSEREYQTSKGKASVITTAHVRFTLVDGETGEKHECEWAGQGDDPADKGLGKAYTNAIKTFLREQFLIPQGDDPEADSTTDKRAVDRAPAKSQTAGNGSAPRRLNEDERQRVLSAIEAANQDVALTLAAVGVSSAEELTVAHTFEVQALLNKGKAA